MEYVKDPSFATGSCSLFMMETYGDYYDDEASVEMVGIGGDTDVYYDFYADSSSEMKVEGSGESLDVNNMDVNAVVALGLNTASSVNVEGTVSSFLG
jgi:hypothetical protein